MDADKESMIELADYIYRDNPRIASLTAQLFGGHLLNTEVTRSGKDATEKGMGLAALVTGAYKAGSEHSRAEKETRQPHDAAAADLIACLAAHGRISDDVVNAKPGQVVRASGTLFLIDGSMLRLAAGVFASLPSDPVGPGGNILQMVMRAVIDTIQMPTGFVLRTKVGSVVGTLDPSGLHAPVTSTYFKHGDAGVPDVGVIGIKERASESSTGVEMNSPLLEGSRVYSASLRDVLFPANGIRVAPIAIYRNIL